MDDTHFSYITKLGGVIWKFFFLLLIYKPPPKLPDFYNKFQQLAKIVNGSLNLLTVFLVNSHVWLPKASPRSSLL